MKRCPACGRREQRSVEANRRYWALVAAVARKVRVDGRLYGPLAWHAWFKLEFIGGEDLKLPGGRVLTQPMSSADAERLYSDPHNAARRLRAIKYLRERSRTGWLLDQPAKRKDAK